MAVPASLSFHLSSSQRSQRCSMPYRSGGHSTAAAISALGGESNYIDGPRRRPSPTTREPAHHRLARPASPAPASTHSPLLRSASCIQMLMLTARHAHSFLLSARVMEKLHVNFIFSHSHS